MQKASPYEEKRILPSYLREDKRAVQAKKTTDNITDFLMMEETHPSVESGEMTPQGGLYQDGIYARTLKRRGPGRPRQRPEPFKPIGNGTIGLLGEMNSAVKENTRVE